MPHSTSKPCLLIFSGLPGAGKSTLARAVAKSSGAVYLRIDTIEQALRDLCELDVEGEGYRLAYRLAADNLLLGRDVIADSCNPLELTRREWETVAREADAEFLNIEVVCSDLSEHQQRIESRVSEVPGLVLPTWSEVQAREYHPWKSDRLILDTAGRSVAESESELLQQLRSRGIGT